MIKIEIEINIKKKDFVKFQAIRKECASVRMRFGQDGHGPGIDDAKKKAVPLRSNKKIHCLKQGSNLRP